jgi:hypothetical protein
MLHYKKKEHLYNKRKISKNRYTRLSVNVKYFSKNLILLMNELKSTASINMKISIYQGQITLQKI